MTTPPDATRRFDKARVFLASAELTAKRLRETSDFWLPSIYGGGRAAPHIEAHHLAHFILANGAYTPIQAGDAVRALRDLHVTAADNFQHLNPSRGVPRQGASIDLADLAGQSLVEVLISWIQFAADPAMRSSLMEVMGRDWTLHLMPDERFAMMTQLVGHRLETVSFGQKPPTDRMMRVVQLPLRAVIIAAELLEDSLKQQNAVSPARKTASRKSSTQAPPKEASAKPTSHKDDYSRVRARGQSQRKGTRREYSFNFENEQAGATGG